MNSSEEILCDAEGLELILDRLARDIVDACGAGARLSLVGVRSRGVPIAQRLAKRLKATLGHEVTVGAVDITLYRDDLDSGERWPVLQGNHIDFTVDGAEVILIDDVLFTGRTARAALNVLLDYGRPARVRLLTMIDRGHRELPIQAEFVGMYARTTRADRVLVKIAPIDPEDLIVLVRSPGHQPRSV
jgi:pyrimidine operon attenuation protein/uracil phosphoribosyltransferase